MLRVVIEVDSCGLLRGYHASGHAGFAKRGRDIVCAAATSLLRTVAGELADHEDLVCRGSAGEAQLLFHVGEIPAGRAEWLRGVTDTLRRGLEDLRREYPRTIEVAVVDRRLQATDAASVETVMMGGA